MSHSSVRAFIQAKVEGLGDDVKFGYGPLYEINQIKDKSYPYVWCELINSNYSLNEENLVSTETYNVELFFYGLDAPDSTEEQYVLILDSTDTLVNQFIRDINEDLTLGDLSELTTGNINISNITKRAFIKVLTDCCTGWVLGFSLTVPDKFDYC